MLHPRCRKRRFICLKIEEEAKLSGAGCPAFPTAWQRSELPKPGERHMNLFHLISTLVDKSILTNTEYEWLMGSSYHPRYPDPDILVEKGSWKPLTEELKNATSWS